jgi:hypothetical protein
MIKFLRNGRLPIVDIQLMFVSFFKIGKQHFYFAIEPISPCVFWSLCHLLQIFEIFISIMKSYWACPSISCNL